MEHGVPARDRDGVEEGGGVTEAAGDGVRGDEGRGGDGARVGAEEDGRGGEVRGEGVEVEEAEGEVRVGRVVEERGGEEARVEAAQGAEEGGRGGRDRGVARREVAEEDGALVRERGHGEQRRRRHRPVCRFRGAHGSPGVLQGFRALVFSFFLFCVQLLPVSELARLFLFVRTPEALNSEECAPLWTLWAVAQISRSKILKVSVAQPI